mgnify:CR=1 FL=1
MAEAMSNKTKAKARVVFKSAVAPRKSGTKTCLPSFISQKPREANPGISPDQFPKIIKRKKVKTRGKNFFAFLPATLSVRFQKASMTISKKFCQPEGTQATFLVERKLTSKRRKVNKTATKREFVTGKEPK